MRKILILIAVRTLAIGFISERDQSFIASGETLKEAIKNKAKELVLLS